VKSFVPDASSTLETSKIQPEGEVSRESESKRSRSDSRRTRVGVTEEFVSSGLMRKKLPYHDTNEKTAAQLPRGVGVTRRRNVRRNKRKRGDRERG